MDTDTVDGGTHELDARTVEGDLFNEIMTALDSLPEGETLVLINSFEPVPLYTVLEQRGFEYKPTQNETDEWHISITHA